MILPLEIGMDNDILRTKSVPIKDITSELKEFAEDMIDTMYDEKNPGVGLAAPQVGRNIRIIVVDLGAEENSKDPCIMINPEIIERSSQMEESKEGCLSLPKRMGVVPRHTWVMVKWKDLTGSTHTKKLENLPGRCVQHEIDHLDGVLFPDRER